MFAAGATCSRRLGMSRRCRGIAVGLLWPRGPVVASRIQGRRLRKRPEASSGAAAVSGAERVAHEAPATQ